MCINLQCLIILVIHALVLNICLTHYVHSNIAPKLMQCKDWHFYLANLMPSKANL